MTSPGNDGAVTRVTKFTNMEGQRLTSGGNRTGQTKEGWESRLPLGSGEDQRPDHRNKVRRLGS